MKLKVATRSAKKSEKKQIRREGKIPAILYAKGAKGQEITVDSIEFKKILNNTPSGTLSSKVFTLDMDGRSTKAIVKEIQYNITTYDVIHLDFEELIENEPVTLNIPLICVNAVDCIGVKLGGVIRQVIRKVKVTCKTPKHIPDQFEIDVRDMNLGQVKKLDALTIPEGVRPGISLNEVAVVIARK